MNVSSKRNQQEDIFSSGVQKTCSVKIEIVSQRSHSRAKYSTSIKRNKRRGRMGKVELYDRSECQNAPTFSRKK